MLIEDSSEILGWNCSGDVDLVLITVGRALEDYHLTHRRTQSEALVRSVLNTGVCLSYSKNGSLVAVVDLDTRSVSPEDLIGCNALNGALFTISQIEQKAGACA